MHTHASWLWPCLQVYVGVRVHRGRALRLCESRPFFNNIQFFILELLLYLNKLGALFGVGAPSATPSGKEGPMCS